MKLHELKPNKGARRPTKRLGRGPGSGQGKTAGRGHKGQNARAGGGVRRGFEGGQMPLQRRLPKRGFANIYNVNKEATAIINVGDLERFGAGAVVDLAFLTERRIVPLKTSKTLRVLGNGALNVSLTVRAQYFTPQARAKIEAAGGQAEVI